MLPFTTKVTFSIGVAGYGRRQEDIDQTGALFTPATKVNSTDGQQTWTIEGSDFDEVFEKITRIKKQLDAAR